jgi:hypothetical protein
MLLIIMTPFGISIWHKITNCQNNCDATTYQSDILALVFLLFIFVGFCVWGYLRYRRVHILKTQLEECYPQTQLADV